MDLCWLEVSQSLSDQRSCVPLLGTSLVLQSLTKAPYEPLWTSDERFPAQKMLFLLALVSAKWVGELHAALSHRISHSRGWGKVSFTFAAGFVAKTQGPSSTAPRFEGFTLPALPDLSTNRNGRLLCPVRAVRCYLDHTAAHCPRFERLFVTAGHSAKGISKNTVSFWLRKTISRAYQLSGRSVPDPPPRARETRGIAPSLLFKKNFVVTQVLKAGTWCRHTTFTCHYLRDLAHRSLETFHLWPVVAARPDIPFLPGLMTDRWLFCFFSGHPPMPRWDVPVQRLVFHHLCFHVSYGSSWFTLISYSLLLHGLFPL